MQACCSQHTEDERECSSCDEAEFEVEQSWHVGLPPVNSNQVCFKRVTTEFGEHYVIAFVGDLIRNGVEPNPDCGLARTTEIVKRVNPDVLMKE